MAWGNSYPVFLSGFYSAKSCGKKKNDWKIPFCLVSYFQFYQICWLK